MLTHRDRPTLDCHMTSELFDVIALLVDVFDVRLIQHSVGMTSPTGNILVLTLVVIGRHCKQVQGVWLFHYDGHDTATVFGLKSLNGAEQRNEWIKIINRRDLNQDGHVFVCEKHFEEIGWNKAL